MNRVMAVPWTRFAAVCSGGQPTTYRPAGGRGAAGNFQRYVNALQQRKSRPPRGSTASGHAVGGAS